MTGTSILQACGIRRGDPLSPLLSNLAYEPLLQYILANSSIKGLFIPTLGIGNRHPLAPLNMSDRLVSSTPIKLLAYANDLKIFLSLPAEWPHLLHILDLYSKASNAKTNASKTMMVSLSGLPFTESMSICNSFGISWHDQTSDTAATLLVYPLYSSPAQFDAFLKELRLKIFQHTDNLRKMYLSVRGMAVAVDVLILSQLWHIMRVIVLTFPLANINQTTNPRFSYVVLA